MKNTLFIGGFARGLIAAAAGLAGMVSANAHPYASGITNDGAGNVRFILNETAQTVSVALSNSGGASSNLTIANGGLAAGVTNKGLQTFSVVQSGVTFTNYSITVSKLGSGVITKISTDTNPLVNFFGPRGVAVNQNPKSKNFGRTYVANASGGATITTFGGVVRPTGRGIYLINADQSDAIAKGTNASAAGITFSTAANGTTYSPFKINVGVDDTLYIADAMTNTCTLYKTDPDVTANTQVLGAIGLASTPNGITTNGIIQTGANHGRIVSRPVVFGSAATSDLTLFDVDTDYPGGMNHILRYNINGGSLPWTNAPDAILADTGLDTFFIMVDLDFGGTNFYASGFRSADNGTYGSVKVFDSTGATQIWDSYSQSLVSGHDPFAMTQGLAVSPDGLYLATIRTDGSNCVVRLTNGIPDLTTLVTNALNGGGTARSICWDAADNFYVVSGGSDLLRVFSLGLSTTTVTSGDTVGGTGINNGVFQLVIPNTSASVTATTPLASQNYGNPVPGTFTFTRAGQNINQPLTVSFTVTGTASNGVDYTFSSAVTTNITFPANQTTVTLNVNPVTDNIPRPTNTVTITLQSGANYSLTSSKSGTVFIQNTGPQFLKFAAAGSLTMYKPFPNDYGSFTFTRYGDASVGAYLVTNFNLSGTAVLGTDFTVPAVTVNPGDVTGTVVAYPLDIDASYSGNKTLGIGLANDPNSGAGYTASTNTVVMTIIDNANPAASVLYSNSLSDSADIVNWKILFASTNDPANLAPDYDVQFGYDWTGYGSGNAPNGSGSVLSVSCNKQGIKASSGVNLYLTNAIFSGDYAVRFNMNLIQGTGSGTGTEGALFGINHQGVATNWWAGDIAATGYRGPWAADGIWWWVSADPGGASAGDFLAYTGTNNTYPNNGWARLAAVSRTNFPNAFKNAPAVVNGPVAPFTTVGTVGVPANHAIYGGDGTWSDVEIKQIHNVVTLSIDKTVITVYTNTTPWTSGQIMLGYDDPFASVGSLGGVFYSNLRVVRLEPPAITTFVLNGGNVTIHFGSIDGNDSSASFALQSSDIASGPYTDVNSAVISQLPGGSYLAVAPQTGTTQFYRLRHK